MYVYAACVYMPGNGRCTHIDKVQVEIYIYEKRRRRKATPSMLSFSMRKFLKKYMQKKHRGKRERQQKREINTVSQENE